MRSKTLTLMTRIRRRHPNPSPDSFVFLHDVGGPYTKDSAGRALRRAVKLSGIAHVRFHDLRHTFLSGLAAKSASNIGLMQAAGHRDFRSTLRYIHGNIEHKRRIANMAAI
ncbi:MAG: tyrosine-type recombinase/integrase [Nitrospinae bacterium]|nr:tyrosine-type recombinase/integrase [Nitrospinota bacterium]